LKNNYNRNLKQAKLVLPRFNNIVKKRIIPAAATCWKLTSITRQQKGSNFFHANAVKTAVDNVQGLQEDCNPTNMATVCL
jgi:hypothetical protein